MKIAWVTPLSARSAIGQVTVRVAEQLRRVADVELWFADQDALVPTDLPIAQFSLSQDFEDRLRRYDAVLYNFGDNYPFHRNVFLMSQRVPGIAILHDFVLHHFFADYFFERPDGAEAYFQAMERAYGRAGREAAVASFRASGPDWQVREDVPHVWATDRVVDFPLFEPALHHATGVVVHSNFLLDRVRHVSDAPSRRLFLPAAQPAAAVSEHMDLDVPADRLVLLTIGHVNANKRVLDVVEVLGAHPDLAKRVHYVVLGALPGGAYVAELRARIGELGLQNTVRLLGRRSDAELQAWLARAAVCLNLRHPVMEGASASLTDQMMAGKTVIVTNAGVYAETPDDCVVKIEPGREVETLPAVLRRLIDDGVEREARGRRSREYAEANFGADRYAEGLMEFIVETGGFAAMAQYTGRVGGVLKAMGVRPGMAIMDTVSEISADLFSEPVTSPWKPETKVKG
jgi:glycosyltransferase involved in cell wall biosynthesis